MTRVLVIEPGTRVGEIREVEESLEAFQGQVGGNIEGLNLSPTVSVYINEDGKQLRLERNVWGEAFILRALRSTGRGLLPGDFIVGPVVIFGGYDGEGENRDVPQHVIEMAREVGVEVEA